MTTAAPEVETSTTAQAQKPADVFVVFGITGDLAKVMTFHSLYRLEQRGLLDCPIVGVAVDDWTVDQLKDRARESIDGHRRVDRREDLRPPRRPAVVRLRRLRRRRDVRARGASDRRCDDARLLPRDPTLPLRPGRQGARRGGPDEDWTRRRREAVRARPRFCPRTRRRAPPVPRRVAALPNRPLPREDGPRRDPLTCASRTRCSSPFGRRNYLESVQITMAEDFGVEDRGHFYDPVGALRDVVVNHLMQVVAASAMEIPSGTQPDLIKNAQVSLFHAVADADPAHYVRGQYDGYLDIDGVAADSTTETYAALRLDIENWRWAGVPFFIRTGKRLPATQTELRLVFKHAPRLGFQFASRPTRAEPARRQARPVARDQARARRASSRSGRHRSDRARHGVR